MINLKRTFTIADDVEWEGTDDDVVLIKRTTEIVLGLSGVGAFTWRGVADGRSLAHIVDDILRSYHVERDILLADLKDLMRDLVDKQVLCECAG